MSLWRKEAFERLPELRTQLQEEKGAYCFVGDLVHVLEHAYEADDEDLIRRIYMYIERLLAAPQGANASNDLHTIVYVSFFEHLPRSEVIRQDLGRWLKRGQLEQLRDVFLYHGTEEQYQEILASCMKYQQGWKDLS